MHWQGYSSIWGLIHGCIALQAELFRLEGLFHRALNDPDAADQAFSTSLALWPQLAAGWLSWGEFCDSRVITPSLAMLKVHSLH